MNHEKWKTFTGLDGCQPAGPLVVGLTLASSRNNFEAMRHLWPIRLRRLAFATASNASTAAVAIVAFYRRANALPTPLARPPEKSQTPSLRANTAHSFPLRSKVRRIRADLVP